MCGVLLILPPEAPQLGPRPDRGGHSVWVASVVECFPKEALDPKVSSLRVSGDPCSWPLSGIILQDENIYKIHCSSLLSAI